MSRYDVLTAALASREEQDVVLTFDELDSIVGGLPASARTYQAWWANKTSSQAHARAWLDAGRRASPDFKQQRAVFSRLSTDAQEALEPAGESGAAEALSEYVESTLSLERDLEDNLVANLGSLEDGLAFVGRQVSIDVGRVDILARSRAGETVVVEVKVGEARESAIAQVAKYLGWYARNEGKPARGILVAASFPESMRYAAVAIPGLRLATYRVSFSFAEANL